MILLLLLQAASAHMQEQVIEVSKAGMFPMWVILAMAGGCGALLLLTCLVVCLCVRCRRKKKSMDLERHPEKLPPAAENNFYMISPFTPPPEYQTTAVKQEVEGEFEQKGVKEGKDQAADEDRLRAEGNEYATCKTVDKQKAANDDNWCEVSSNQAWVGKRLCSKHFVHGLHCVNPLIKVLT